MMYVVTPHGTKLINRLFKENATHCWAQAHPASDKGGLGFKHYLTHSHALLNKWVAKALNDPTSEWASLFMELFANFTWESTRALALTGQATLQQTKSS